MKRNLLIISSLLAACGSDSGVPPTLDVDIFGWQAAQGFVSALPVFEDAQTARVQLTRPADGAVLKSQTTPISSRSLSIPDLEFGTDLRLDFDVLNSQGAAIGSGATPTFTFGDEQQLLAFRVQVTQVNTFAPVGNVVVDRDTKERKFAWTQFDYRGKAGEVTWLGRAGHASAPTADGRVIIVGGGDPLPGTNPGEVGEYRSVYADVQVFDPQTGYFTDLAFDEQTQSVLPDGRDTLFEPVVHHTLTPLADGRFLVAGGFTPRSGVMRPVNTLQIIDLEAPAGSRVQRFVDANGSSLVLGKARGRHTATFRAPDNAVVVAGGIGPQGDDDGLDTFEIVQIGNRAVSESGTLQQARAQHAAVLMLDSSIWLIGGHNGTDVHSSTEVIKLGLNGSTTTSDEADMRTPRFAMGAVRSSQGAGDILVVAGGYSSLDGTASDAFEVSRLGRGQFDTGSDWTLSRARGGVRAIELPQTNDIVLIGGRDSSGGTAGSADVLVFEDLAASPPFLVQESASATTPRYQPTIDLLSSGHILLVGGEGDVNGSDAGLDTADFFNPDDPVGGRQSIVIAGP